MDIYSPRSTCLQPLLMPNLPAIDTNTESSIWYHYDYVGLLLTWKRNCFVLTGIDTLDTDLTCLYTMPLPKLSFLGLQNLSVCLSTIIISCMALLLIKEFPLTANEVQPWTHAHNNSLVLPCSPCFVCLVSSLCWFRGRSS